MPDPHELPHGRERRRHPRTRLQDLPLTLESGRALRVRDLSRSGVCVFSDESMRTMTHVRFAFDLGPEAGGPVGGDGVVVRCERLSPALGHFEVAIFFQQLDPGASERLTHYLAQQARA